MAGDLVTWYASGLADGSTVAAGTAGSGDTPITAVGGTGTRTITKSEPVSPALALAVTSAVQNYVYWDLSASHTVATAFLSFKVPNPLPSASFSIFGVYSGATTDLRITVAGSGSPGSIRLLNSAFTNAVSAPNGTLTLGSWYRARLDLTCAGASSTAELKVYDPTLTTLVWDSGVITSNFGTSYSRIYLGTIGSGVQVNNDLANVDVYSTTYEPPAVGGAVSKIDGSGVEVHGVASYLDSSGVERALTLSNL